jgi:predicted TIM-barrel fold metal-dependent hydrolase
MSGTRVETAAIDWVDAHVHIFPPEMIAGRAHFLPRDDRFAALYCDPRARMATAEEVIEEMDRTGVRQSIVCGFAFRDQGLCRLANDYILEAVARWPERLAGLAVVAPGRAGCTEELVRCLDAGMRGCGELAPHGTAEGIAELAGVAGVIRERDLALMLHSNEQVGHAYPGKGSFGPECCVDCAAGYPGLRIVFAHMGGGAFVYESMPELRATLTDVYYDTAAVPFLYDPAVYHALLAGAGAGKLIFGSDYGLLSPARYFPGLCELPEPALAAAAGGNARKVYKL